MHSELRELSKKVRDKPEKEKDWNNRREKESKLISKLLDKDNSLIFAGLEEDTAE